MIEKVARSYQMNATWISSDPDARKIICTKDRLRSEMGVLCPKHVSRRDPERQRLSVEGKRYSGREERRKNEESCACMY